MVRLNLYFLLVISLLTSSDYVRSQNSDNHQSELVIERSGISDSLIQTAEDMLSQRQFPQVIELLSPISSDITIPSNDEQTKVLHMMAMACLNVGNPAGYDYMKSVFDYAIDKDPPSESASFLIDYAEALTFSKTMFAYDLIEQAIEMQEQQEGKTKEKIRAYQVLAKTLLAQAQARKAIIAFRKAIKIYNQNCLKDSLLQQQLFSNLAIAFNRLGEGDSAMKYSNHAYRIILSHPASGSMARAQVLGNLSRALMLTGYTDSAIATRKQALEIHLKLTGNKSQPTGGSYYHLASAQFIAGRYHEALVNTQKSILTNYPGVPDTIPYEKMPSNLTNNTNVNAVMQGLMQKVYFFEELYKKEKENKWIELARNHYMVMDTLVNMLQQSVPFEHLPTVIQLNRAGYDHALEVLESYREAFPNKKILDDLYYFAVATKAKMLAYQISSLKSTDTQGLEELSKTRAQLEEQLVELKSALHAAGASQLSDSIRNLQFTTQMELLGVIDAIGDANAKDNKQDLSANPPTLPDIRRHLDKDEALIEYVKSSHSLYIFCSTDTGTVLKTIAGGEAFNSAYREFLHAVKTGGLIQADYALTSLLLEPVYEIVKNKKHLTIIPDQELFNIPFEAINIPGTKKPLIENHTIAYNYSAKLWLESKNKKMSAYEKELIAIAPGFTIKTNAALASPESYRSIEDSLAKEIFRSINRSVLAPLPYSLNEVEMISGIINKAGQSTLLYTHGAATESRLRALPSSRILHIATHGFSSKRSPEESGLFFAAEHHNDTLNHKTDGFLHINELFSLDINNDLVILSACKSGAGKILEGEGVYALPRGFIYAGVPNLIASLWKVHDQKTMELITKFYELLAEGMSYRKALQQTKIQMIKSGELPLDWSGMILIGH